jgi:hypothetical protein
LNNQPSVMLVAAKWWPLSARLGAALHRLGCTVSALCPPKHPLTHISGVHRIYQYGGIFSLASVRRALHDCRPDIVVPCDDGVVAQLHALHALDSSLRSLIERSLGPPESYPLADSRYRFLRAAIDLGLRVPRTRRVAAAEDLVTWHENVAHTAVLKVDGETGGHGVRISRTLDDSFAAWRELRSPHDYLSAWKRLAIDRDVLALWSRRQKSVREVTVQEYIPGRPANAMLACWGGKLLSMMSVVVVATEGPTGAATIVRVIENEDMRNAAKLITSRLILTGFYGLDFILESRTGVPYLIEMNPRCTQLGHIELPARGSLAGAFSAALRGEPRPRIRNPICKETIALFPQALAAGEACRPYIDASYHDLPSEDPQLMAELLLKSWPQRRWAARLYHAFNPQDRADPIVFEDLDRFSSVHLCPRIEALAE